MKNTIFVALGVALLLALTTGPAVAVTRYALLIGVSSYPMASLEGPINDVAAMKNVLVSKWSFPVENITILLDKTGTKKNILQEIERLNQATQKGDELFVYFSGHGTSAEDRDLNFPLPTTSGAFIPYDVREAKDLRQAVEHLVIGKTDLRPLLTKLDKGGRHVFVAIDACYSGNAVRGAFMEWSQQLPSRFLDLRSILPARAFGDDLVNKGKEVWAPKEGSNFEAYPYENIYYLSASGEHEQAKDIPERLLKSKPTVDGKAHGAFTDTLLRVLIEPQQADFDNNKQVTYAEITKSIRQIMRERGFDHTPNGLPSVAEDSRGLSSRGLFRNVESANKTEPVLQVAAVASAVTSTTVSESATQGKPATTNPTVPASAEYLRVRLDGAFGDFASFLAVPNIKVVSGENDLTVKRQGDKVLLVSAAGDLVTEVERPNNAVLVEMVKHQAWVHGLVNQKVRQDFNVFLDLYGQGRGSVAVRDEEIGFTIKTSKEAYIFLLDIDPMGTINVLYPYYREELVAIKANQAFIREKIAKVGPPYGRDYVQVFAFDRLTSEMKQLVAAKITQNSKAADLFKQIVDNPGIKKGHASMELVTADR